jgi:hypothetical protein
LRGISVASSPCTLRAFACWLVLALCCGGCGTLRYAYAPVTTTSAEVEGHAAAVAAISGKGELRVASLGVAEVTPPSTIAGKPFRALFVRFVVDNQSDEAWTFDPAEQRIELPAGGTSTMRWASTATGERPPVVHVAARSSVTDDVLFSIGARDEGDLARFDVVWTVRPRERVVTGRAAFVRHITTREPAPAAFEPVTPPMPPALPRDPCLP